MIPTSSAQLTCLCGAISESGSLLTSPSLPITSAGICHCNPCRQTTGSLSPSFPPLNSSPAEDTLSRLKGYRSSDIITRYFCSKCGCHCFLFHHPRNKWYCLGGIIEPSPSFQLDNASWPKNIIKVCHHEYIADTIDGGLTPVLLTLGGRSIPTWTAAPGSTKLPHDSIISLLRNSTKNLQPPGPSSYLPAKCHCGGVSLLIKRANYNTSTTADFPARYIPSDPTKWLSYFCACRSCRLSFGVSLSPWTLVLPTHVFNAKDPHGSSSTTSTDKLSPVTFGCHASDRESNPGLTLKHHWSSPDVCRSFCSKCGASVSYWCEQRPDELDLASGLFRDEQGIMSQRWLEWVWGKCSSTEESIDKEICDAWVRSGEVIKELEG